MKIARLIRGGSREAATLKQLHLLLREGRFEEAEAVARGNPPPAEEATRG
ncbi:hypothetical protein [Streptomyces sp. NPDC059781]